MSNRSDPPKRPAPAKEENEIYGIGEIAGPRPMPDAVQLASIAMEKRPGEAEEPPPLPRRPMLSGVFTFPFYLGTLAAWMFITLGLMVTGWLLMFLLQWGTVLGFTSARLIGAPTIAAGLLTLGYAATCCLMIIEQTSYGWDKIEVLPEGDWKEWVWNYAYFAALLLEAALAGAAVRVVTACDSWILAIATTVAVYPLVLLGALAADRAWAPTAIRTVLASLVRLYRSWALFYGVMAATVVAWVILVRTGLEDSPWLVPLYAAPLLSAIILIWARMVGRIAAQIRESM